MKKIIQKSRSYLTRMKLIPLDDPRSIAKEKLRPRDLVPEMEPIGGFETWGHYWTPMRPNSDDV